MHLIIIHIALCIKKPAHFAPVNEGVAVLRGEIGEDLYRKFVVCCGYPADVFSFSFYLFFIILISFQFISVIHNYSVSSGGVFYVQALL